MILLSEKIITYLSPEFPYHFYKFIHYSQIFFNKNFSLLLQLQLLLLLLLPLVHKIPQQLILVSISLLRTSFENNLLSLSCILIIK